MNVNALILSWRKASFCYVTLYVGHLSQIDGDISGVKGLKTFPFLH